MVENLVTAGFVVMFVSISIGFLIGYFKGNYTTLYLAMILSGLILPLVGAMSKQLVIESAKTAVIAPWFNIYSDFACVVSIIVGIITIGTGISGLYDET